MAPDDSGALRLVMRRAAAPARPEARPAGGAAEYYARIEAYAQKIRETRDVPGIIGLLEEALVETRALHSPGELADARRRVRAAEQRIEQLKSELELINQLVRQDALTGALNRRGVDELLEREAARADRRDAPLCVVLLDIDDFKRINDAHGHSVGDEVLRHLVCVAGEIIRAHDAVGRYGGEEFVLVLPDATVEVACAVVARLQDALAQRRFAAGTTRVQIAFSAGIAQRRRDEDRAALFERADQALYEAKRVGKNRAIVAA